jgi:hypothetical protein
MSHHEPAMRRHRRHMLMGSPGSCMASAAAAAGHVASPANKSRHMISQPRAETHADRTATLRQAWGTIAGGEWALTGAQLAEPHAERCQAQPQHHTCVTQPRYGLGSCMTAVRRLCGPTCSTGPTTPTPCSMASRASSARVARDSRASAAASALLLPVVIRASSCCGGSAAACVMRQ